jgi:hypothetical protein
VPTFVLTGNSPGDIVLAVSGHNNKHHRNVRTHGVLLRHPRPFKILSLQWTTAPWINTKTNTKTRNSRHYRFITAPRYNCPASSSGGNWIRHRGSQRHLLPRWRNRAGRDVRINKIRVGGKQGTGNLICSTGTTTRTDIFAWTTFSFPNLLTTYGVGGDKRHATRWSVVR